MNNHSSITLAATALLAFGTATFAAAAPTAAVTADSASIHAAIAIATAPATTDEFPITIEHAYGTTEVAAPPQRVITLGWLESDTVVALGIEPVGVSAFPFTSSQYSPWLERELGGTPQVISTAGSGNQRADLPLEALAALEPDLIIATTYIDLGNFYDELSRIAPVVGPTEIEFARLPWAEQVRHVGAAIGRSAQADELVATTEAALDEARANTAETLGGSTYVLALGVPDTLRIVQDEADVAVQLLGSFGLGISPQIAELEAFGDGSGGAGVSLENVELIDADVVIIGYLSPEVRAAWEASPLFARVPAVADGRYLPITPIELSALRNPSPLSLPYAIEGLIEPAVAVLS